MSKIEDARKILKEFGLPQAQQNDISAYTLLALGGIKKNINWSNCTDERLTVSKGIMAFIGKNYRKIYAPNTRETFRRQVLHQLVQAGIVLQNPDDLTIPTNSSKNHYAISKEALKVIRSFKTNKWKTNLDEFRKNIGTLLEKYSKSRNKILIPIKITEEVKIALSSGKHNELQKSIIEVFAPSFAKNSEIVYIGDTANKEIIFRKDILDKLKIPIDKHSKLPDIILFLKEKKWIYLIEAVTSHEPISGKRIIELEKIFKNSHVDLIFVTVFPDRKEFKAHIANIAWETEVWIASEPSHLIHFNGEKFLGPYTK